MRIGHEHFGLFQKLSYQEYFKFQKCEVKHNVYLASVCVRVCVFKNGEVALNFESHCTELNSSFCWSYFFPLRSLKCPYIRSLCSYALCVSANIPSIEMKWGTCCTDSVKIFIQKYFIGLCKINIG